MTNVDERGVLHQVACLAVVVRINLKRAANLPVLARPQRPGFGDFTLHQQQNDGFSRKIFWKY